MVVFGFVISAFTPLVLYWMCVVIFRLKLKFVRLSFFFQFRSPPSSCCMASLSWSGCCPCTRCISLATQHGWTCSLQDRLHEERSHSLPDNPAALWKLVGSNFIHLVRTLLSILVRCWGLVTFNTFFRFLFDIITCVVRFSGIVSTCWLSSFFRYPVSLQP